MATEFTWVIESMSCYPQYEGETDVVFTVYWRLNGTDGEGHNGTVYGSVGVTYDSGTEFTPYDELTQEQVVGWVKEALGPDQVASYEVNVEGQIEAQINPPFVSPPLPWA